MNLIAELRAASGKQYTIDEEGFLPGAKQYIDRDYAFDHVPDLALGHTHIRTAGNDKMIGEHDLCLSFVVAAQVTVFIVYADKLHVLPCWLTDFRDTGQKVTRTDSNPSTLKGIFTLYAKEFEPGPVHLNGNLSPAMAADPVFQAAGPLGTNYCMYSVVVKRRAV